MTSPLGITASARWRSALFWASPLTSPARFRASATLRGVRNLSDLQYEVQQSLTNREVAGLETAFAVADQSFAYASSSLIKQITAMGEDLSVLRSMVPELVIKRLEVKKKEQDPSLERPRAGRDNNDEG